MVDANIVVAALIRPGGWTAQELARNDVEWLALDFLFRELDEHGAEYAEKAGCSLEEWKTRLEALASRVRVVPLGGSKAASSPLVRKAEEVDPDDAVYVEALVAEAADLLWTRDGALLDAFPGIAVSVIPRSPPSGT